jgi:CMP-N,N'-diacetyllegionaminic acid synthase|tara:strand:+ start:417 stop:1112 length:696 start_codon:yes stop_codon:yes gene_type:complete
MKILCTVCVRAGSKGLRDKNFLKINNKYLLSYTLDVAKKSKIFDKIIVSTDSKKIKALKKVYNDIDFIKRPKNLATDSANKMDAIRHAMKFSENKNKIKYDLIFDLDATSALRSPIDIKKSLKIFKNKNADNLFSVNESRRNPYFNVVEKKNGRIKIVKELKKSIIRRQNAPKTYDMNASIYIWKRKILLSSNNLFRKKTKIYIMDIQRSIDVDNKFDLLMIKNLIKKNIN